MSLPILQSFLDQEREGHIDVRPLIRPVCLYFLNGIQILLFNHDKPFSSVAQSYPTLCNPMNRSTPGLPVLHQLPGFTQTHIHRVSDAIQPSHPLSSPSPPAPNPSSIRVFSNESTLRMRWPKYWSFSFSIIPSKEIPGLISFRMDWLDLLAVQISLSKSGICPLNFTHRKMATGFPLGLERPWSKAVMGDLPRNS